MPTDSDPGRYEVELKFRDVDHERLAHQLRALGAEELPAHRERDIYLAHPARDFVATGEVFRIRTSATEVYLSYKGPKLAGPAKTREELEVLCRSDEATLRTFCERLGFRPVRSVEKERRPFLLEAAGRRMTVVLDRVTELGSFAEVETLASGASDLPQAQRAVAQLAAQLALDCAEPRSYLRMLLEHDAASPSQ
jgi:adenylate cyclase class 2